MQKAYLTLADGCVYSGFAFGYPKETTGEAVFTTSMIDYMGTLTDPDYFGQIVVSAFPLIGCYGVITKEVLSDTPALSAFICRDLCEKPSNFRCEMTLDEYLKEKKIPGIYGIDTRSLVRHIRDNGTMYAKITLEEPDVEKIKSELADTKISGGVAKTSVKEAYSVTGNGKSIAVLDLGNSKRAIDELSARGFCVTVLPYNTSAEKIKELASAGIVITDGPGCPSEAADVVTEIKKILALNIPVFGIGLGYELLAVALGGKTEKLKYGHRGGNQPVVRENDGRVFITLQNHGYSVDASSLPENVKVNYLNANDGTAEGFTVSGKPVFGVQFTPETTPGPESTGYLFDEFAALTEGGNCNA